MGKEIKLEPIEWYFYNYLEKAFKENGADYWVSKAEMMEYLSNEKDFYLTSSSHDLCPKLNSIRLKLNKARHAGIISHLVLLHNDCFKLAKDADEAKQYSFKDYKLGLMHLVRYYQNIGVLTEDGQGKLIDCKGNVISDETLAKRFNEAFNI